MKCWMYYFLNVLSLQIPFKCHVNLGKFFWFRIPFYNLSGPSEVDSSCWGLVRFFPCLLLVVEREQWWECRGLSFSPNCVANKLNLGEVTLLPRNCLHICRKKRLNQRLFFFFASFRILCFQEYLPNYLPKYYSFYFIFVWCYLGFLIMWSLYKHVLFLDNSILNVYE